MGNVYKPRKPADVTCQIRLGSEEILDKGGSVGGA